MKKIAAVGIGVLLVALLAGSLLAAEEGDSERYLWKMVNVDDAAVEISGRWLEVSDDNAYGGLEVTTTRSAAYVEFTFRGSGVRWIGSIGTNRGMANVYLNDELVAEGLDAYRPESEYGVVLFEMTDLEEGVHTLKIDPTGETHEDAVLANVNVDAFAFVPTLAETIGEMESMIERAVIGAPRQIGEEIVAYHNIEDRTALEEAIATAAAILEGDPDPGESREAIAALRKAGEVFADARVALMFPDRSGSGRPAVVSAGSPLWIPGRQYRALLLDGSDQLRVDDVSVPDNHTIEFWMQMPESGGGWLRILGVVAEGHTPIDGDRSPGIWQHSDFTQSMHWVFTPENIGFWAGGQDGEDTGFDPGRWYHVAGVKEGETLSLYVNGKYVDEADVPSPMDTGDHFLVGFCPHYAGRIMVFDEIRFWDRALTAEEIAAQKDAILSGEEEGLIGYWTFDELYVPGDDEGGGE